MENKEQVEAFELLKFYLEKAVEANNEALKLVNICIDYLKKE